MTATSRWLPTCSNCCAITRDLRTDARQRSSELEHAIKALRAQPSVVKFGQSASLSSGQAGYGADVRDGVLAAFNAANKADGKGPRFQLETLDDGGDKERCKTNVRKLIESSNRARRRWSA
jgi:ABC-type branched-subunit amino acid transport system substrate-binding protein